MTFTHRPSYPDEPKTHATHRLIFFDGKQCGGIAYVQTAHRGWVWEWGAIGPLGQKEMGEAQTREEALALAKDAAKRAMEKWPGLLEENHAFQERAREAHNERRRRHGKPERPY